MDRGYYARMARALVLVALTVNAVIVAWYAADDLAEVPIAAPFAVLPVPLLWMRRGFRPLAAGLGISYLVLAAVSLDLLLVATGVLLLLASIAPAGTLFIGRDALCRPSRQPRH